MENPANNPEAILKKKTNYPRLFTMFTILFAVCIVAVAIGVIDNDLYAVAGFGVICLSVVIFMVGMITEENIKKATEELKEEITKRK